MMKKSIVVTSTILLLTFFSQAFSNSNLTVPENSHKNNIEKFDDPSWRDFGKTMGDRSRKRQLDPIKRLGKCND
jgi:major membrane immunogen (membrane-anchored lipoprotein)